MTLFQFKNYINIANRYKPLRDILLNFNNGLGSFIVDDLERCVDCRLMQKNKKPRRLEQHAVFLKNFNSGVFFKKNIFWGGQNSKLILLTSLKVAKFVYIILICFVFCAIFFFLFSAFNFHLHLNCLELLLGCGFDLDFLNYAAIYTRFFNMTVALNGLLRASIFDWLLPAASLVFIRWEDYVMAWEFFYQFDFFSYL